MCGFTGFIDRSKNKKEIIEKMNNAIAHRGPDGEGFFVDSTVHHIYEKKGQIDLLFQIPDILYSTIISSIIGILIKNLALSNNDMLKIKQIKNIDEALRQSALLVDKLIIKFNLFFILCSIFSVFFLVFYFSFLCCI